MNKTRTLESIADKLTNLKKSPLYTYRTSNKYLGVPGEGSENASIVFVGEAPGRNEAKTGKPFCGAAGKILDKLLGGAELKREEVFVTNIVKDRPPENRDPSPEEIKVYGPLLDAQIDCIQPKVIVTLGRYAMGYIMEKFDIADSLEPIGDAHGKEYTAQASYGPVTIITLYHPCVAIYNNKKLPILMKDFKVLTKYAKK